MKKLELRNIIKEEIRKILKEDEIEKKKIISYLISKGNNSKEAEKMVNQEYDWVARAYKNASISKKAEIIRSTY